MRLILKILAWEQMSRELRIEICSKNNDNIPDEYLTDPQTGKIHSSWKTAIQLGQIQEGMLKRVLVENLANSKDQSWQSTALAQIILKNLSVFDDPSFKPFRQSYRYFDFVAGFLW